MKSLFFSRALSILLLGTGFVQRPVFAAEPVNKPQPTAVVAHGPVALSFGGERHNLLLPGGGSGFVILPKESSNGPRKNRPWLWYAPTFLKNGPPGPENGWLFSRLLDAGVCIAGADVGESYGNPNGREAFTRFYNHVRKEFHLSAKPCLLPQSRGGLMLYNWATENPEKIQCIGGIYTVCNLTSYPGLDKAATAYGMSKDELAAQLSLHNPIDRLAPLVKARVPIFHIHGDTDKIVPLEKNAGELIHRYKTLGGSAELVIVPGKGHQVCPEFFQSDALLRFFLSNKGVQSAKQPSGRR